MNVKRNYTCQYCNTAFSDRSNKYRHETKYCKALKKKLNIIIKPKYQPTVQKTLCKPIEKTTNDKMTHELLEELKELRQRVSVIENEPRSTHYNNWIIIGTDIYHDMVDKYGRHEAISFLTQSAISGDSVDVIKKLYLDGVNPEKYPIACKNYDHFRYLNDKREVIDDKGGISVQKLFSNQTHRAMVLAANEMIQEQLNTNPNTNALFVDLDYDMRNVQCKLASIRSLDMNRLAGITHNPNHPFFVERDEVETYRD
jgi:hypothetical protein